MRQRPFAFLPVGNRWINMTMVTDIEDHGDRLVLYLTSEMARLAGRDEPTPLDVARRVALDVPEEVDKIRRWLMLNDED